MNASHLLSLSALHAAAPGVLDVVFGPDGTFEGAPAFSPPLWTGIWSDRLEDPICQWGWCWGEVYMSEDGLALFDDHRQVEDAYLDCRIPSVAARLAGLCARALDVEATGQAWATEAGEIRPEFWVLRYCDTAGYAASVAWCKATGRPDRRGLSPCPPETPSLPAGLADVPSFLAALTLSLAPKIAALGGPR